MRLDYSDPTLEEKREILDLLHITIKVNFSGEVKLEGWFGVDSAVSIEPTITIRGSKDLCFSLSLVDALFINPIQQKREASQTQI